MAQFFGSENIPTPVVASTTTLTLAATNLGLPTVFLVGGQAYTPSGTITLNTATTGANGLDTGALSQISLYYIYAIVNNSTFVPALVASLAVPSTGPSMAGGSALNGAYGAAYKLVGAFYTNGSSQVGSIVTITGPATTGWMDYPPTTAGLGTVTVNFAEYKRAGSSLEMRGKITAGTPDGSNLAIGIPTGLTAVHRSTTYVTTGAAGTTYTGSAFSGLFPIVTSSDPSSIYFGDNNSRSVVTVRTANSIMVASGVFYFSATLPIVGWNASLL